MFFVLNWWCGSLCYEWFLSCSSLSLLQLICPLLFSNWFNALPCLSLGLNRRKSTKARVVEGKSNLCPFLNTRRWSGWQDFTPFSMSPVPIHGLAIKTLRRRLSCLFFFLFIYLHRYITFQNEDWLQVLLKHATLTHTYTNTRTTTKQRLNKIYNTKF